MREVTDLHIPFKLWLDERGIPYVYHRPDKRSGIGKGWPDFTLVYMGRTVMIECKTPAGRLSDDQSERIRYIQRSGCRVEIALTLEQCIEAANSILCDHGPSREPVQVGKGRFAKQFADMKRTVAAVVPLTGKRKMASPETPLPQGKSELNGQAFAIANWSGTNYVMAAKQGGRYAMIRKATLDDEARFPKVP